MIETLRKLMMGLALAGFTACPPPGPNPPTPPTPTPPPPIAQLDVNRTLRVAPNSTRLTLLDGTPFNFDQGVQCCMPAPAAVGNSRWPLSSESQMDYFKSFGLNAVHFRLGPFFGDADHESEWADTGGAYIGSTPDFNPAFWNKVEALVQHAYDQTMWVEINIIDTWYCKHANSDWGDQPMPWPQADIDACGRAMTPVQEAFIRQAVKVLGKFPNVIWATDNEGGEIRQTKRVWYEAQVPIIRDEESKNGYPAHLIGTNNTDFADGPFDYVSTHDRAALLAPIAGKWTLNNERNPEFSAEQEISNFKQARDAGLSYAFWRAEMSEATMTEVLEGYKAVIGGGAVVGCFPPAAEDPRWITPPQGGVVGTNMRSAVEAGKANMPERCGTDHQGSLKTLELLGSELRKLGYCAGLSADSVFILNPEGLWQEFHAVSFATGCWANDPAQLPKNTWTYAGTNPVACTGGSAPVDQISCKEHQATNHIYDCTPKINGGPVRPEGDPERAACEAVACGGTPTFSINSPLTLTPRDNPYQFKLSGTGTGLLTSTCPRTSGDLTGQVVTQ